MFFTKTAQTKKISKELIEFLIKSVTSEPSNLSEKIIHTIRFRINEDLNYILQSKNQQREIRLQLTHWASKFSATNVLLAEKENKTEIYKYISCDLKNHYFLLFQNHENFKNHLNVPENEHLSKEEVWNLVVINDDISRIMMNFYHQLFLMIDENNFNFSEYLSYILTKQEIIYKQALNLPKNDKLFVNNSMGEIVFINLITDYFIEGSNTPIKDLISSLENLEVTTN